MLRVMYGYKEKWSNLFASQKRNKIIEKKLCKRSDTSIITLHFYFYLFFVNYYNYFFRYFNNILIIVLKIIPQILN